MRYTHSTRSTILIYKITWPYRTHALFQQLNYATERGKSVVFFFSPRTFWSHAFCCHLEMATECMTPKCSLNGNRMHDSKMFWGSPPPPALTWHCNASSSYYSTWRRALNLAVKKPFTLPPTPAIYHYATTNSSHLSLRYHQLQPSIITLPPTPAILSLRYHQLQPSIIYNLQ